MAKDKFLLNSRNQELNSLYLKLSKEGYRHDKILKVLSGRFYLAERTVYGIVSGEYERRKQNPGNNGKAQL